MAANKKVIFVGILATLLVAGAVAATVVLVRKKGESDENKKKNAAAVRKAAESLCQKTSYKETCIESLSHAEDPSDPIKMIREGFKAVDEELQKVLKQPGPLKHSTNKDNQLIEAYQICAHVLHDSIVDIQKTLNRTDSINQFEDIKLLLNDVETWLTGALTFQTTCVDEVTDVDQKAGETMREMLNHARELTLNGLNLAQEFSEVVSAIISSSKGTNTGTGRRLMMTAEDQFDIHYLSPKTRRLLQATPQDIKPHAVVAKDGSGKYETISEALKQVPKRKNDTFVIYIKEGVYEEYVHVQNHMWSVMFLGDGPTKTKITGNKSHVGGIGTYNTATVIVEGDNFIGKDIGFENSAGAIMHQAVALRVTADKTICYNCQIDGYQDTLYIHSHRQYYRNCVISGTIDFIFGNAEAVFQNCTLFVRMPLPEQKECMVTAQGKDDRMEKSAIVLQNCRILPAPEFPITNKNFKAYLGRPWKPFSTTIIMNSFLDTIIMPEGWSTWNKMGVHLDTCWYAEVDNHGPGAHLKRRVKWQGIKKITIQEAMKFTPGQYLYGDTWIVGKGIPYDSGLMPMVK